MSEPIPANVRRVLRRCLEKDPKKRLRDISGVALLLEQDRPRRRRLKFEKALHDFGP